MIYLDNAATTLEKPAAVSRAMLRAIKGMASPGRGGYLQSQRAADTLYMCRELAAELFDVEDPQRIVFTFNATHALNIAIKSLVKPGTRVLISGYEHNAVTRPLYGIDNVEIKVARGKLFDQTELLKNIERELDTGIPIFVCTHVSNVFGYVLPMDEIAKICRKKGVALIVDASQSAGCLPVSVKRWGAKFVAMPGHKALFGPQGTGLLLCANDTTPILEGGTGSESLRQAMPDFLPDRLEAGTHNVPGIAGLLEGLRFIKSTGVDTIRHREGVLLSRLYDRLSKVKEIELFYACEREEAQNGVLSFRIKDRDCQCIGEQLAKRGIAVRSGLHCAPLAHETAGTVDSGTVRVSVCAMTTLNQIDVFASTLKSLIRS